MAWPVKLHLILKAIKLCTLFFGIQLFLLSLRKVMKKVAKHFLSVLKKKFSRFRSGDLEAHSIGPFLSSSQELSDCRSVVRRYPTSLNMEIRNVISKNGMDGIFEQVRNLHPLNLLVTQTRHSVFVGDVCETV